MRKLLHGQKHDIDTKPKYLRVEVEFRDLSIDGKPKSIEQSRPQNLRREDKFREFGIAEHMKIKKIKEYLKKAV